MVITIWIDDQHPVTGRAGVDDQQSQPFAGWLQLLAILHNLIESERQQ
jgi:hypothetical protein